MFKQSVDKLCQESNGVFRLEDTTLASELFDDILDIEDYDEDQTQFADGKAIKNAMVDNMGCDAENLIIKSSEDARNLAYDYRRLYEEMQIVEDVLK